MDMKKYCWHVHIFFIFTDSLAFNKPQGYTRVFHTSVFSAKDLNYFNGIVFLNALTYSHCNFIAM